MARPNTQTQRRQAPVAAAAKIISEQGVRSVSLADVAEEVGLSRGAVHYYYGDMDELLVEVHRAGTERFCDERDRAVAAVSGPREQLTVAIRRGLPEGPDDELMKLIFQFNILSAGSELHLTLADAMYLRQVSTYQGIIERGVDSGEFTPTLPPATIAMNLAVLEDAYSLHIVNGNAHITVESAESAIQATARSLGVPPAR
ncbi:TetR/AcrR family transcriptional regulator [Arthrobacter woluwensis]|uniref:TetR/AcrR family transcriptional regulator n=1 Tax=Arthrobacter woluwensis TaxID=156980 RepID=UPI001AAFE8D0|nr:TetR/AcrR family transcriptional regulator [Arthrobacter woluwensis]QTF73062.1 TetR/AcrR family transcriptional regulator [Arthrobacter woluwensis]